MDGKDYRLTIVTGRCSVHETEAALDYTQRLKTTFRNRSRRTLYYKARLL